jgi:hypothetical protein
MSEVVLGVHPNVHAAYQANKDAIGVSTTALYNKLDRVETAVSAALVRDSAELAEPVVKALRASHPRWLSGYQIKVLDGNHVSSTEHRLKEWRDTGAAPFPGQAWVVLDQQRMLITDVLLSEDGHAQERSLITQVLQHVRAHQLWIEDRNFCTLGLMFGMARRGAAFEPGLDVAAQNRAIPDAAVFAELYVPKDCRVRCNERRARNVGRLRQVPRQPFRDVHGINSANRLACLGLSEIFAFQLVCV